METDPTDQPRLQEPTLRIDGTLPNQFEAERYQIPAAQDRVRGEQGTREGHAPNTIDFPSTNRGWIGEQLLLGVDGRAIVVTHVMASYARPLERYLRGSSYRNAGEPHELVQGFRDFSRRNFPQSTSLIAGWPRGSRSVDG